MISTLTFYARIIATNQQLPKFLTILGWHRSHALAENSSPQRIETVPHPLVRIQISTFQASLLRGKDRALYKCGFSHNNSIQYNTQHLLLHIIVYEINLVTLKIKATLIIFPNSNYEIMNSP